MPTDFLSLVRREIFVTDIRCFVAGMNRIFKYVSHLQDCCFALRVKTLCKHMHCARVMRCDAVCFGIYTILDTVVHPENVGSMSSRGCVYICKHTMRHISEQLDFMIIAVAYSVWLFVSKHFCPI